MIEAVIQGMCILLSSTAIRLVTVERGRWTIWGCGFGLAAQPFWFASGWAAGHAAIMVMSSFYAWSYWKGLRKEIFARRYAAGGLVDPGVLTRADIGPPPYIVPKGLAEALSKKWDKG